MIPQRFLSVVLLTLMFSGIGPAAVAAPPSGLREVRTLGGITEYTLEANGLQVLLMPVPRAPRTSVTVTYRVGSRHEQGADEAGMAHLLEHVSFHATETVPDIAVELQRLGARFNGTTSVDRTNYFASFAAGEPPATLRRVLQLEASRMHEARLAEADLAREKPIVLDELALRGQALAPQMQQALAATAFRSHGYGRPVIGSAATIEQLSLPALRAFYARHYRPDRAVLMLAGAFDVDAALAAVVEAFGPLVAPADARPDPVEPPEPTQALPRVTTLRTRGTALAVGWRVPGMAHPQAPALALLNLLLPGPAPQDAQRLPGLQLQPLPGGGLTREPGLLGRTLLLPTTPSGDAASREALEAIEQRWLDRLQEPLLAVRADAAGEARLQQLREALERNWRAALQDPERAPALISDAIGAGDWRLAFHLVDGLQRVRASDVIDVAETYLRSENRSLVRGVTDPAASAVPQTVEQALGFFAGLFSRPVEVGQIDDPASEADRRGEPSRDSAAVSTVEMFETDPARLDAATVRHTLPSGLRMAALARPAAGERVSLQLRLRWASPREAARGQAWRVLPALLGEGTSEHTAQQLGQLRQRLQMQLGIVSGPQGLDVQLQARRDTLAAALALLREMLEKPLLPEAAFRREQAAALARLAAAGSGGVDERERQYRMLSQGLNRGEPGYQPSAAELAAIWREMRVDDARAYQQRFWSANEARIVVVGALPDQLPALLEEAVGRWKKPEAPRYEADAPRHLPERAQRFVSRAADPAQGVATVSLHQEIPLQRDEPDAVPLQVAARILAGNGESGGNRLADRLRSAESLSYAVGAQLRIADEGNRSSLRLQASSAPRHALRVEAAMREEIARALADGVSEDEVESARRWLKSAQRQALLSDRGLEAQLMAQLERGSDFAAERSREDAALAALTPASVDAAMRRLLRPDGWVAVVRGMAAEP